MQKKGYRALLASMGWLVVSAHAVADTQSVNEQILDILLQKQMVSPQKHQALKKQSAVEAQEVRRLKAVEQTYQALQANPGEVAPLAKKAPEKTPAEPVKYSKGFVMQSADGNDKLLVSGRFQGDYKALIGENPGNDSFFVRRARLAAIGTWGKHYNLIVESDFGSGSARLIDGFFNIRYVPYAQFQVGQFKIPFSMEELHANNWIDFAERSLANNFSPSRDLGAMIHGKVGDDLMYYQFGLFNGRKVNASSDVDDHKDIAGRLTVSPFAKIGKDLLKPLHLSMSFTGGAQETSSPSTDWWRSNFETASGTDFLVFQDRVKQDGTRRRLGYEMAWLPGPVSVKSEYMTMDLDGLSIDGGPAIDTKNQTGYFSMAYLLTGEQEPWKNGKPQRIPPKRPFTPGGDGWGAWQLLARYEWIDMDQSILNAGLADATKYTNEVGGFALGLNWYPTEMVRLTVNYYDMRFDEPVDAGGELLYGEQHILSRMQIVW